MDKGKALETLRGMKFMQRKEEMKRRELFEMDQQRQYEERMRAAINGNNNNINNNNNNNSSVSITHPSSSSSTQSIRTPTILYDTSFPTSSYTFSRRSFLRKPTTTQANNVGILNDDNEYNKNNTLGEQRKEKRAGEKRMREDEGNNNNNNNNNKEVNDLDYANEDSYDDDDDNEDIDDPTAVWGEHSGKRFCVKSNAPVLPKSLEKQMSSLKKKRDN